ncbi:MULTISPECIES: winged helix-turn-helix domain-containing protein [Tenebrionibacter/Tenebrionicola group]|jgi:cholera toxin transcriptional activator|uniref:Winged helix-turn-helix domain-containing protein n=2 Tax=Tenebrionibacter/Tenebrionicola group TaxID=2969848 RepID=A0A8K0V9V9_9ENTR|nr:MULTISPECIES: winged helix-turn-helix domain-containing protein [Tenebrionibacter/Tenebrionicola group]MBK4716860.1 winged helix-turn-helix domain-containing protein [Tenebrionibacter intestinalis]MBV5097446.1 winged helix-turn-helix domain-containing protein [Tenebrionicola larvae]
MLFTINGLIVFDSTKNILQHSNSDDEAEIKINQPASRCLFLLIQNSGKVIDQQTLIDEVWRKNGMEVTLNTLYQNISILRKALKSIGLSDNVIITVPKKGIMLHHALKIERAESFPLNPSVAEASASVTPNVASGQRKRAGLGQYKLLSLIALLLTGLISGYVYNMVKVKKADNFQYLASSGGCNIYIKQSRNKNIAHELKKLSGLLECNRYPYVYLSFPHNAQSAIIMCSQNLELAGQKLCDTKHISRSFSQTERNNEN